MDEPNMISSKINHISDTALWVAVYRAMESKRKDALFKDPYAEILAGERGREIVRNSKAFSNGAWSMIVRTAVIDKMVERIIKQDNVDTVLNLAAGLDARPYRLSLPASLRWIEVDLPDILNYKEQKLSNAKPNCKLERIKQDLTDINERKDLFEKINSESPKVLVISEGILVYLTREEVARLTTDLYAESNFNFWIFDLMSDDLLKWLLKKSFKQFTSGNVQMKFAPEEGVEFFSPFGWKTTEVHSVIKEARRLKREMPMAWLLHLLMPLTPKKKKEFYSKLDSYFVLLRRE